MTPEWCLVVRCKGQSLGLVSIYGSQSAMEARANLALAWDDRVEYLGPRIDATSWLRRTQSKDSFASISDLKDTLKKRRSSSSNQEDFQ